MASDQFGAKPAVLRCARCGKFVGWEEAQVQIVCTCRPRLDLPPVFVREATDADRPAVRALFESDFGRTKIVAFGEVMEIDLVPNSITEHTGQEVPGFARIPVRDEVRLEKRLI
jgi:hypothetical protein